MTKPIPNDFKGFVKWIYFHITNIHKPVNKIFRALGIGAWITIIILNIKINNLNEEVRAADGLKGRVANLEKELIRSKMENKLLLAQSNILLEAVNKIPTPIWTKKLTPKGFVGWFFNEAYLTQILQPKGLRRYHVLGETDYVAFDSITAAQFQRNDSIALVNGFPTKFDERDYSSSSGAVFRVIKYPKTLADSISFVTGILLETIEE